MTKAKPIPEGFRTLTPHLAVRGAAQAIDFYKQAFGAVEISRMPGPGGLLMHAELKIGDSVLMLADEFPGATCKSPASLGGTSINLHIYVEDVDKFFARAVGAGAKVTMPVADMFWGDRYGKLTDPFGHDWSVATHIADYTPEEMEQRAAEAMKQFSQQKSAGQS